ncbi:MAG TPA: peptidylprolyl isomerase [Terriglobales bacterium]|jgi:hypothetical protein|nr:peptidylprolyl isomerase [Terriglobales bacterium]
MSLKRVLLSSLAVASLMLLPRTRLVAQSQAQESKSAASATSPAPLPSTDTLPRDYAVISVDAACPQPASPAAKPQTGCKTIITREEFEALVNAVNPKMTVRERRDLAQNYGRALALSQVAIGKGLDKGPGMDALLHFLRSTALASAAFKEIFREAGGTSTEQIREFYEKHKPDFERFNFQRIFIPREKQGQTPEQLANPEHAPAKTGGPEGKEMKDLADQIHAKAVAGEDFLALQKSALQAAGLKGEPQVAMDGMARGDFPESHNLVFDLALGAVSPVLTDPNGYYIYKLISKETPAFESIREAVSIRMRNQNTVEATQRIEEMSKATVDAAYFDKYQPPPTSPNQPDIDND